MPTGCHHRHFTPDTDGYAIGHTLARLHSLKILHGDAHRGNWLFDHEGRALVADPRPVFLHCLPSPEQCATDIRPLLPALDSNGWMSFRLSYRKTWPEEGRVIEGIALAVVWCDQGDRAAALDAISMVTREPEQLLARLEPGDAQLPIMNL